MINDEVEEDIGDIMSTKLDNTLKKLNVKALIDRIGDDDEEFFCELINEGAESFAERLDQLEKDFLDGNIESVVQLSHSMKGTAANISAEILAHLCGIVEDSARDGDISNMSPVLAEIRESHQKLTRLLTEPNWFANLRDS